MWLILRWMPDAFQPRWLAAASLAAAVAMLFPGCGPSGPPAVKAPACVLDLGALSARGCRVLKSDTAAAPDPRALWGKIDCASDSRHRFIPSGGDPHPTGGGQPQPNRSYRRLTVIDGDQVFGERCELGYNDYRRNTFGLYHEGERRITFMSIRLPTTFPLGVHDWQLVMQMKQTQPADNDGTPVLALEAQGDRWRLFHSASVDKSSDSVELWSAPAAPGRWTRFAFDVVYSQDTSRGRIKVYADLNGDGDALDPGEQSPEIATYTLKRESAPTTSPDDDPIPQGASIPSHLRMGIYHDDPIACPAPRGCAVDVDNVQVFAIP
jgi:Polysaccharide lyase